MKWDKEPWSNVEAPPGHLHGDRPRLPGREGLGELDDPGLRHGAAGHRGLHVRRRPTTPTWTQIDREDEAAKILDRARLRPRQSAEDGDPLQHVGEPQEHGDRHPGAAEAARHRGHARSTPTPRRTTGISSRRATSTWRAPAGSPTTRTRNRSSASRVAASGNNYSNYNSPEFEELMKEAAAAGGNPEERLKLLARGREGAGRRPRQHPAALLQLPQHRLAEAEGLGGERDGRASLALHQQGRLGARIGLVPPAVRPGGPTSDR